MAESSRPAEDRNWRGQRAVAAEKSVRSPAKRKISATLLTLFAAVLLAVFGYVVAQFFRREPHLHLAVLPIGEYERSAPSLFGVGDDAAALEETFSRLGIDHKFARFDMYPEAADWQDRLPKGWRQLAPAASDPTALYVFAHGVSLPRRDERGQTVRDGFLLGSTFRLEPGQLPADNRGAMAIGDFLSRVADADRKGLKIVVLDSGRLDASPRMGMLANEFPLLLAEQVAALADENVWVLHSNSWLERAHSRYEPGSGAPRSIFAQTVARALAGDADGAADDRAKDDKITLRELCEFVRRMVAAEAFAISGEKETQTPLVLHGGVRGDVPSEQIPDRFLAFVPRKEDQPVKAASRAGVRAPLLAAAVLQAPAAGQQPAADNPAAGKKPPADPGANPAGADAAGTNPSIANPTGPAQPPADSKPADSKPGDAKPAPAGSAAIPPATATAAAAGPPPLSKGLANARRLWDAIGEHRRLPGGAEAAAAANWAPIDYSPLAWRGLEADILQYERAARGGGAVDRDGAAADLLLADVQKCLADRDRFAAADSTAYRLREVWLALQLRNDLLAELPQFFRWYAHRGLYEHNAEFDAALDALAGALPDFIAKLHGVTAPLQSTGRAVSFEIRDRLAQLDKQRLEIAAQRAALYEMLSNDVDILCGHSPPAGVIVRIEDLLATLLPAPDQREQLWRTLERLATTPGSAVSTGAKAPLSSGLDPIRVRRASLLWKWAGWEIQQAHLVADAATRSPPAPLDGTPSIGSPEGRRAWAEAALQLADWQQGAAGEIERLVKSPAASDGDATAQEGAVAASPQARARAAEMLARLAAIEDVAAVQSAMPAGDNPIAAAPFPEFSPAPPVEVEQIACEPGRPGQAVPLRIGEKQIVRVSIRASCWRQSGVLRVDFDYNSETFTIEPAAGASSNVSGPLKSLTFDTVPGDNLVEFELWLRPTRLAKNSGEARQELKVRLGDKATGQPDYSLTLALPAPDQLSLAAVADYGLEKTVESRRLLLDCFPNGATKFKLFVTRTSAGEKKTVKARFWRLPPPDPSEPYSVNWLWEQEFKQPGRHADWQELIPGGVDVPFEAGQPRAELSLKPPMAPPAATGAAAAAAPAATAPPASAPAPPPNAALGLLCELSDPSPGSEPQYLWVIPRVMHPDEYMEEPKAEFSDGRILIEVHMPEQRQKWRKKGATIRWETDPDRLWGGAEGPSVRVRQNQQVLNEMQPDANFVSDPLGDEWSNRQPLVFLTVDDYPRAYVFRVRCDGSAFDGRPLGLHHVRFQPPSPRAYGQAPDKKPVQPVLNLAVDAPRRALAAPWVENPLYVLEISEAGKASDPQDSDRRQKTRRYATDRQFHLALTVPPPEGALEFTAKVEDLQIPVALTDDQGKPVYDGEVNVSARLLDRKSGREVEAGQVDRREATKHLATLVMDIHPPTCPKLPASIKGAPGKTRTVDLAFEDPGDSGVQEVQTGLAVGAGSKPKPEQMFEPAEPVEGRPGVWRLTVALDEKAPKRRHTLFVKATDAAGNSAVLSIPVEVASATVDEDMPATRDLEVTVVLAGAPARGVAVTIDPADAAPEPAKTGDDGKTVFKGLKIKQKYKLTVGPGTVIKNAERSADPKEIEISAPTGASSSPQKTTLELK